MANTSALKNKILRQIRQLEADLRAIERVEQIERGLSSSDRGGRMPNGRTTLIGRVEDKLRDEWTPVSVYLGLVQAEMSEATRTAVSTALQRLATRGIAESRGSRKTGYEYRKRSALAANDQGT